MVRCILGLGSARSLDYPFRRAHVGRAFVEHIADTHGFGPWRPVSGALSDVSEHASGLVLCRLWPESSNEKNSANAARQCVRYLGVRSAAHVAVAHAEPRRPCGNFSVVEGHDLTPIWATAVVEALSTGNARSKGQVLRLLLGVGAPGRRQENAPNMDRFGEMAMSPREAAAVLDAAFPSAYEWLVKRWLGPMAVTEGHVYRKRLPQDTRRGALKLPVGSSARYTGGERR